MRDGTARRSAAPVPGPQHRRTFRVGQSVEIVRRSITVEADSHHALRQHHVRMAGVSNVPLLCIVKRTLTWSPSTGAPSERTLEVFRSSEERLPPWVTIETRSSSCTDVLHHNSDINYRRT